MKRSRKHITLQEKYKALKEISQGVLKKNIAEKHGVAKNTISTWIQDKHKIIAAYESGRANPKRNKTTKAENEDLDKSVFTWFKNSRENDISISGLTLKGKALQFAKSLNLPHFKASDGWLDRWKSRNNVVFRTISGEEKVCTSDMTAGLNETYLPTILSRYNLRDKYNASEFGLFYQILPLKNLYFKGQQCSGEKHSKVTGLAAANAMKSCLCLLWESPPNLVVSME